MLQIMYVSHATAPFSDSQLRDLLARARERNTTLGVTGMLLHQAGAFIQILEGNEADVEAVLARIKPDKRHSNVLTLSRMTIDERNFGDWSMGFVDVRGAASRLPGFRGVGVLSGLIGDASAIERVVNAFRDGRWRTAT